MNSDQQTHLMGLCDQLVQLYGEVKGYVIASEKLAPGARVSVPALNELRNAFDHWMRAEGVWRHGRSPGGGAEPDPFRYCEKNLQKALGHVYRAGYDALDVLALHHVRRIETYYDSYHLTTLHTVIPDFAARIRKPFEAGIRDCEEGKKGKDVEPSDGDHPRFFDRYLRGIERFTAILDVLEARDADLDAVEAETAGALRRQRNLALAGIAVTVVLAVLGIVLTLLLAG